MEAYRTTGRDPYPEKSGERLVGFAAIEKAIVSGQVVPAIVELSAVVMGCEEVYWARLYRADQGETYCAQKSFIGEKDFARLRWREITGGQEWPEGLEEEVSA